MDPVSYFVTVCPFSLLISSSMARHQALRRWLFLLLTTSPAPKQSQPSQPVSSATFSLPVSCLISREFHLLSSISKMASWIIPLCPKQERLWLQTDCNNYWGKSKEYFLLSESRNAHFSRAKKEIVERVDCEMWLITEMLNSGHFFSVLKITNMLSHKHTAALKLGHEPQTSFITVTFSVRFSENNTGWWWEGFQHCFWIQRQEPKSCCSLYQIDWLRETAKTSIWPCDQYFGNHFWPHYHQDIVFLKRTYTPPLTSRLLLLLLLP